MNAHTTDDELTIPADDPQYNTCEYDRIQNASGAASKNDITTSADLSTGYHAIADPKVSESPCEPSVHSRDTNSLHSNNERYNRRRRMVTTKMKQVQWTLVKTVMKQMRAKQKVKPRRRAEVTITTPWCTTLMLQARLTIINTSRHTHMNIECYRMMRKESQ